MTNNKRIALRAAVLIHEQMAGCTWQGPALQLPEYAWDTAVRLQRQIAQARRRGWHRAAESLLEDLARSLRRCQSELEAISRTIEARSRQRKIPAASEIYRDILAIEAEFDEFEIELKQHEVVVTTDRIVLEDIALGRFEIRLDWQRLGTSRPYRVVALEPNPAAANEEVTHPHVQGETLCEGEGRAAIQAALAQGRLHDFFVVVSQVLNTYGRGGAYVELDGWDGINCDDCGASTGTDDHYVCGRCGNSLCADCQISCAGCEESYCSGCLSTCPECEMEFCRGCLNTCSRCGRRVCGGCLEKGLCPSCHEEQSKENENDDHQPTSPGGPQGDGRPEAEPWFQNVLQGETRPA